MAVQNVRSGERARDHTDGYNLAARSAAADQPAAKHPLDFRVYVTSRCNSRCRYCYRGLGLAPEQIPPRSDLPPESLFALIDSSPEPIESIKLSGGEPSFHPEIGTIIDELAEREIFTELYSNGALTRLPGRVLDKVGKFNLSFDSLNSGTNDHIRGDRHASRAFDNAIKRLRELDKDVIEVQITLSRASLTDLDATIEYLVEELGIDRIKISDIVEEYAGQYTGQRVGQDDLAHVLEIIEESREKYHFTKIIRSTSFDRIRYLSLHRNIRHLRSAFINQKSDLYIFIAEHDYFKVGNVEENSVENMWSEFARMESKAEKFMDYCFSKLKKSDLRYVTPTEYLYDRKYLTEFIADYGA